jgi:E-phenylitaconyl-CoA hydratase
MAETLLNYRVENGVARLTLCRPDRLNALSDALSEALNEAWLKVENDPDVLVAILDAEGRHFCAGADMTPGAADLSGAMPGLLQHLTYIGNGLDRFKPVIGLVQGYALGAGYLLATRGCDIVIAAEDAQFGYPEGPAGIALSPLEYLPYMPFKQSLEFMLLAWKGGRMLDANRALELGLVNKIAPADSLEAEGLAYAELLKQVPPLYVKAVKHGHYRTVQSRTAQAERDYVQFVRPQERSDDRKEAAAARSERRKPQFKGR